MLLQASLLVITLARWDSPTAGVCRTVIIVNQVCGFSSCFIQVSKMELKHRRESEAGRHSNSL